MIKSLLLTAAVALGSLYASALPQASSADRSDSDFLEIYLPGDMNGWSFDSEWQFSTTDGIVYTLSNVTLPANTPFKIATSDWSTVDYGYNYGNIYPNITYSLNHQGANMYLASDAVNAQFIFNRDEGTLIVSSSEGLEIYLRGYVNDWGTPDEWKFQTEDGIIYVIEHASLGAGQEFKVATSDWETVNAGQPSEEIRMLPNIYYRLTTPGKNCCTAQDFDDVTIIFNLASMSLVFKNNDYVEPTMSDYYLTGDFLYGAYDDNYQFTQYGKLAVLQKISLAADVRFWLADKALDVAYGSDSQQTLASGVDYQLTANGYDFSPALDLAGAVFYIDTETMTFRMEGSMEAPVNPNVYLRGTMNDWDTSDQWMFKTTDNITYTLPDVTIEAGAEFKVATSDWATVNYGGAKNMEADVTYYLSYEGENCTVAQTLENVTVVYNRENNTLMLATNYIPQYTIYLRGDFNNWDALPEYQFGYEGLVNPDGTYMTLLGVTIHVGQGFKIADANWGEINCGSVENMLKGYVYWLYNEPASYNCTVAEEMEDVDILFNTQTYEILFTDHLGISSISNDEDSEPVYYNLQGVKVDNPSHGTFVKVQNGSAAKVRF